MGSAAQGTSRNAETTRTAIRDAAAAEFALRGFAGARIERIEAAAGRNRASIYAHFGSKEGLFGAVIDELVRQTMDEVPLQADDLAGYAVGLFDLLHRHPDAARIALWDRLERGAAGLQGDVVTAGNREKIRAVEAAQRAGSVNGAIPAEQLLNIIVTLSRMPGLPHRTDEPSEIAERRHAVHAAVTAITRPGATG